jgi:hypothetical protein
MKMQAELAYIDGATDMQLLAIMEALDDDPAPQNIKDIIMVKINNTMNDRLGF